MVISKNPEARLSAFGCEVLARIAIYHTKNFNVSESKEQNEADLQQARFISRLCATSASFTNHIRRNLFRLPAALTFTENTVEITCRDATLKFVDSVELIFFLELIQPRFDKIIYNGTFFYRADLLKICNALIGDQPGGCSCFDKNTLLKFDKLGNDNAYGTLIEKLSTHVKRIEVDDEFAAQLRDKDVRYDFLKVKSHTRVETYYTKSYFDIYAVEYDLRNVCTLTNLIMFSIEDFDLEPRDYVKKIWMSLGENETDESIENGAKYLQAFTPDLEYLSLTQHRGLIFGNAEVAYQAATQIEKFIESKYGYLAVKFPKVKLDITLELLIYLKGTALTDKINWFEEISKKYPETKRVLTESNTQALLIERKGIKEGDKITIRVHTKDGEYVESDGNSKFPHLAPSVFE
ncbi:hypothetical protein M3Y97_00473400 [Aphelenchoides bicaudatus]|nr:hypothetical protein M3Y97_00473400 [Aphelenchoides bicaudatus]